MLDNESKRKFLAILKEELVPAMGCTEPISLAYAAAILRQTLGRMPERVEISVSGNIIKNVKSVVVPNTGGLRGIETAVAAGLVAGRADRRLEVLSEVTEEQRRELRSCLQDVSFTVSQADTDKAFFLTLHAFAEEQTASVTLLDGHTNVTCIEKNGEVLFSAKEQSERIVQADRSFLTVENIVAYAQEADLPDVKDVLDLQIAYNKAIAREGLKGTYGASIGKILLLAYGDGVSNRAKAWAAAGSDARMSGCELPVVINSGSGNQGMAASLPVIVYAEELHASDEELYRALLVSNLVTIHLKSGIGCLSAYCGAISAGCGAGAGVTYLYGGRFKEIAHTIVNALAINSGVVCDGAKASCAAKVASAVEAGLLGMQMYRHGSQFVGGDGLVSKGIEHTIENVCALAREGMRETDKEILKLMLQNG